MAPPVIRTCLSLPVFLVVAGGLAAAIGNLMSMQCGSACGPLPDTEELRQVGIGAILAGLAMAPVLIPLAIRSLR